MPLTSNPSMPPPPPPLPLLPTALTTKPVIFKSTAIPVAESDLECSIQCEKHRQCLVGEPTLFKCFRPVVPILQEGPTCGMAALAGGMSQDCITPERLKELAISKRWSLQGEMFSCEWMAELARMSGASGVTCIEGGLATHLNCIADCICSGGFVLVPYDKTKNHSPGLLGGVSAHWALITGLVALKSPGGIGTLRLLPCECERRCSAKMANRSYFQVYDFDSEYRLSVGDDVLLSAKAEGKAEFAAIYVCAYQGLSRHVSLWPFPTLCASNSNLMEVNANLEGSLILPTGGIEAGLCGKAVLVYPPF